MAKRLIKIAKELNVGTSTIVEHLHNHGFDIDNKPTAKITDDMYDELLKEFAGSMTIKEQADKMVIGTRTSGSPKEEEAAKTVTEEVSPESKEEETEEEVPEEEAVEEEVEEPAEEEEKEEEAEAEKTAAKEEAKEKEKEKEKEETEEKEGKPALKVVGKIDLEEVDKKKKGKKKKKEEEKETEAEEEKVAAKEKEEAEEKKEAKKKDKKKKDKEAEEESKEETELEIEGELEEDVIKADAPQLKGLKVLGKIDSSKLDRRKKKEKKEKEKKPKPVASSDKSTKKKRRRKRRKIGRKRVSGGRRSKRDETQEVSQKEIEEKIKATMARISGGGKKSKRQRVRRESREEKREKQEMREQAEETGKLELTEFVTVQELANLMDVSATEVITTCMNLGVIVSINQRLDAEIIELVAEEYGHEVEFISAEEHLDDEEEIHDDPEDLKPRSPIVTVMGHVDHGKTSLLDYIREANVVGGEAGGITQHIGAYEVTLQDQNDKRITFLDTPGHEAFTAMRARGAKVTDVAVIIVAADDRVMPQTKEAISHAQAAGVPIVFAVNKVDKEGAQPERIKQELAEMNLLVEEWGGKIQSQDISAKTGQGIDELLEKIILEAELLELKANPDRHAVGVVIEASLDKGRGYVTKILVQTGTLKIGDPIIAGEHSGKVKAMFNERGKRVKKAGPSNPVLVLGLSGAPQAGEIFKVTDSEQEARSIATKRAQITREQANRASKRISLDEIGRRLALGNFKELNLIVKGDVDGSVEALSDSLIKLSIETVQVNVIHKAVGQIKESDVLLASASDAIVIGFQVRPSLQARNLAEREGVEIKLYSIIYEAIEEVKSAIEGMLEPTREEKIVGQVEVQEIYKISRIGTVAGCLVQDGSISRNSNIRVIRDGIVVYPTKEGVVGELASLKRYKDDVKEVKNGMECGLTVKNYNDIKVGDVIEAYEIIEKKQRLE